MKRILLALVLALMPVAGWAQTFPQLQAASTPTTADLLAVYQSASGRVNRMTLGQLFAMPITGISLDSPTITGTVSGSATYNTITLASPNISGAALPANGFYLAGTNMLGVSTNSTNAGTFDANGNLSLRGGLTAGTSVSGTLMQVSGANAPTNGIYLPAANTLGIAANSALVGSFTATGMNNTVIGATTPLAITGTTITAGTAFRGTDFGSGSASSVSLTTTVGTGFQVVNAAAGGRFITVTPSNASPFFDTNAGSLILKNGGNTGLTITGTQLISNDTNLMRTTQTLTNGGAASNGTLTNAPAAGNPTKWAPVDDNGTTRYVPMW